MKVPENVVDLAQAEYISAEQGTRDIYAIASMRTACQIAFDAGRKAEREECAKIAEGSFAFDIEVWMNSTKKEMTAHLGNEIAAAIRARGEGERG